ncbi:MAG: metallophosphoesterase, partial [Rhizobacter sp.]|nr:metallophosphoesterase [Bacteriovorax sp.]
MNLIPTIVSAILSVAVWLYFRLSFRRHFVIHYNLNNGWAWFFDFFIIFSTMFRFLSRTNFKGGWFTALTLTSNTLLGFFGFIALILLALDGVSFLKFLRKKYLLKNQEIKNPGKDENAFSRRNFLKSNFTVATVAGSGIITGVGFVNSFDPKIVPVNIPLAENHSHLKGLKIVQLSDMHIGPVLKADFVKLLVEKVNALNPDIVVITGDIIDGQVENIAEDLIPLKELKSKHGTFFTTGNHEYYWNSREWSDYISSLGIKVLNNENVQLTHNDSPFYLAGVTDISSTKYDQKNPYDPAKAIEGIPVNAYKILMSHQPKTCFLTSKLKYDVQLSGHTHGGQGFP